MIFVLMNIQIYIIFSYWLEYFTKQNYALGTYKQRALMPDFNKYFYLFKKTSKYI